MSFIPVGMSFIPVGMSFIPVGMSFIPVGMSFIPVGMSFTPVGMSFTPVGMSLTRAGMSLIPVGMSLTPAGEQLAPTSVRFAPASAPLIAGPDDEAPASASDVEPGTQGVHAAVLPFPSSRKEPESAKRYFMSTVWQPLQPKPVFVFMSYGCWPMATAMPGSTCSCIHFEISGLSLNCVMVPPLNVRCGRKSCGSWKG